jgi:hypothetical protein
VAFDEKFISAPGVLECAGRRVKRYHVTGQGEPIETEIEAAAFTFLVSMLPEVDDETPPAAFAILHRNGQGAFLDSFSWVWGNVIESRTAVAGVPSLGCEDDDPTRFTLLDRHWIGCVWELAPFGHERSAWIRHVLEPDVPDPDGYLADTFPEGSTGLAR